MTKVHLILVDGMRPDSLAACGNGYVDELLEDSLYTLEARTVFPSMTLPCHMSLFHSVEPSRHGISSNIYTPQVRPVNGICEQLKGTHACGMIYNWEELRDLARPGSLAYSEFFVMDTTECEAVKADEQVTLSSVRVLREGKIDFLFTYLGATDEIGHNYGWMTPQYLDAVSRAFDDIREMLKNTPEDTLTIITADHGGHERTHGLDIDEDMTTPVILNGPGLRGKLRENVSIKDIAPTIVKALGADCAREWEGTPLI